MNDGKIEFQLNQEEYRDALTYLRKLNEEGLLDPQAFTQAKDDFTRDEAFLRETAFPPLRGAAQFCLDWLVERDGFLTTCPSTSPENSYVLPSGEGAAVDTGTACDLSLIRDLFLHCAAACRRLGEEPELADRLEGMADRLAPLRAGSGGQLLEWSREYPEADPGHRHVSHLVGLYPGDCISRRRNPELLPACEESLRRRLARGGYVVDCRWRDGAAVYARVRAREPGECAVVWNGRRILLRFTEENLTKELGDAEDHHLH